MSFLNRSTTSMSPSLSNVTSTSTSGTSVSSPSRATSKLPRGAVFYHSSSRNTSDPPTAPARHPRFDSAVAGFERRAKRTTTTNDRVVCVENEATPDGSGQFEAAFWDDEARYLSDEDIEDKAVEQFEAEAAGDDDTKLCAASLEDMFPRPPSASGVSLDGYDFPSRTPKSSRSNFTRALHAFSANDDQEDATPSFPRENHVDNSEDDLDTTAKEDPGISGSTSCSVVQLAQMNASSSEASTSFARAKAVFSGEAPQSPSRSKQGPRSFNQNDQPSQPSPSSTSQTAAHSETKHSDVKSHSDIADFNVLVSEVHGSKAEAVAPNLQSPISEGGTVPSSFLVSSRAVSFVYNGPCHNSSVGFDEGHSVRTLKPQVLRRSGAAAVGKGSFARRALSSITGSARKSPAMPSVPETEGTWRSTSDASLTQASEEADEEHNVATAEAKCFNASFAARKRSLLWRRAHKAPEVSEQPRRATVAHASDHFDKTPSPESYEVVFSPEDAETGRATGFRRSTTAPPRRLKLFGRRGAAAPNGLANADSSEGAPALSKSWRGSALRKNLGHLKTGRKHEGAAVGGT